jgi:ParB family transcriptional regulator, chromosome partitioning protein
VTADKKGRRALGRGLDALFTPAPSTARATTPAADDGAAQPRSYFTCPIERVLPRRDQPRRRIDVEALAELAATIREVGIIQPLVVRRVQDDRYELIAGERRWRAAQQAGLKEVPVVVKDVTSAQAFELALVENLQRADLNPVEVAEAYERLLEEHGYTQEELAERVGKSRVTVTNALRLLKLPEPVRGLLAEGTLSEAHGRTLLAAPDDSAMLALGRRAAREQLSVRRLEELVKKARAIVDRSQPLEPGKPTEPSNQKSPGVRDLEMRLTRRLGARVEVEHRGPGGRMVVAYADLDDLDRILARLGEE